MITLDKWPLVAVSIGMIVGAVIDGWKFKVPNWLTFPLIIAGWLLGLAYTFGPSSPYSADVSNRLAASLAGTFTAFILLGWMYAINYMGAGDVKLLMGFGSWIGAYFGSDHGLWFLFYAYSCGVLCGGIMAIVMMIPNYKQHLANFREIMTDWVAAPGAKGGLGHVAERAAARKSQMLLLPYGVPLTIGMVAYFWLREYSCLPEFLNPYP